MVLVKILFTFQLDIYSVFNINYCEHFTPTVSVTHSLLEGAEPFHLSRLVESFRKLLVPVILVCRGGRIWCIFIITTRGLKLALRAERLCTGLVVLGITVSWPRPTVSDSVSGWDLHFSLLPCSQCCRCGNHILRPSVLAYPGSRQGVWSVLPFFCLPW